MIVSIRVLSWVVFLTFGPQLECGPSGASVRRLSEPAGVKTGRRNIIALSSVVVLAGLAGADPGGLDVLGMKPNTGPWGVTVLCGAAIAAQLYWYCVKYFHMVEEGEMGGYWKDGYFSDKSSLLEDISLQSPMPTFRIRQHRADWVSNCVASSLTITSWCFIASWLASAWCSPL